LTGPDPDGERRPDEPDRDPPARPGTSTFTIEGRAAPALFVVGWLGSLMGLGLLFVSLQAGGGLAGSGLFITALVLLSVGLVTAAGSQGIERRARGVAAFAGPSPVLVFFAFVPAFILGTVAIATPLAIVGIELEGPTRILLAATVQLLVYVGLVRLLVVDTRALSWAAMGFRGSPRSILGELAIGASWALPVIVLTAIVAVLLGSLLRVEPEGPLPPAGEPVGFAVNLIVAALIAPFGEEIFFRGFATTAWVRALGPARGIVRGGLFFAVVHVLTIEATATGEGAALALIAFLTRVPVGLVLGWLYVRRDSIWAPIGLHAAFNGALIVLAELATRSLPPTG